MSCVLGNSDSPPLLGCLSSQCTTVGSAPCGGFREHVAWGIPSGSLLSIWGKCNTQKVTASKSKQQRGQGGRGLPCLYEIVVWPHKAAQEITVG